MLSRLIKKIVDNNLAGLDDKKFRFSFSPKTDYYEKDINIHYQPTKITNRLILFLSCLYLNIYVSYFVISQNLPLS